MTELASKLPVLVVDDSPFSRKLVEHALADSGYCAQFAKSGSESMKLLQEHRPAIVITDWMLPDLSGPELCEQIRRESADSYTYIILLTSMTEKEDIVKGLSAGADDDLTNPSITANCWRALALAAEHFNCTQKLQPRTNYSTLWLTPTN